LLITESVKVYDNEIYIKVPAAGGAYLWLTYGLLMIY